MKKLFFSSSLFLIFLSPVLAVENKTNHGAPDQEFKQVLLLIGENHLTEALAACQRLIAAAPGFHRVYPIFLNLADAEQKLREAVDFLYGLASTDPDNPVLFYGLGLVHARLGEDDRAWGYFSRAIDLQAQFPDAYTQLARCGQKKGTLDLVRQQFEKKTDDPFNCFGAGVANEYLNNYSPALKSYQKSRDIARARGDQYLEGRCLNGMGKIYWYQGDISHAVTLARQAVEIARQTGDVNSLPPFVSDLGIVLSVQGKDDDAIQCFQDALNLSSHLHDDYMSGRCINNQGVIHARRDDLRQARQCYEQSLAIARRCKDRRNEGNALRNVGTIQAKLGSSEEALNSLNQAYRVGQELGDKKLEAEVTLGIGAVYQDIGEYNEATGFYQRALDLATTIKSKETQGLCLAYLGSCLDGLNEVDQSMKAYADALKIFAEIDDQYSEASCLESRAYIHLQHGQTAPALADAKKSLALAENNDWQLLINYSCLDIAFAYLQAKEYLKANEYTQRILTFVNATEDHWLQLLTYELLGQIAQRQAPWSQALKHYQKAIAASETVRQQFTSDTLKKGYFKDRLGVYRSAVGLLLKLHQQNATAGNDRKAFAYCERAKARTFLDSLQLRKNAIKTNVNSQLLERKKDLEEQITENKRKMMVECSKVKITSSVIRKLKVEAGKLQKRYQDVLLEITLDHPRFAALLGIGRPLNIEEVQRFLEPDEVVVEYMVGENDWYIFIVGKDFFTAKALNVSPQEVRQKIAALRKPLDDFRENKIDLLHVSWDERTAHELYLTIFAPIETELARYWPKGASPPHLIIVPDDALFYIPFEALVTTPISVQSNPRVIFAEYQNTSFLLQKYPLSYAASASVLDPRLQKKAMPVSGKLLAFANPYLSGMESKSPESAGKVPKRISGKTGWTQLSGTEKEVGDIAAIVGRDGSRIFLGKEASEGNLKREAGKFTMLHIATHGSLDQREPVYSGLVLAQDIGDSEDGVLETHEICNLDLHARLVVLSACETALGELCSGEGMIGLTRAFLYAGAQSVVASLWPVEDSTTELMRNFYQELNQGTAHPEALRRAKLNLLKAKRSIGAGREIAYANPFFWAPFVLYGR